MHVCVSDWFTHQLLKQSRSDVPLLPDSWRISTRLESDQLVRGFILQSLDIKSHPVTHNLHSFCLCVLCKS